MYQFSFGADPEFMLVKGQQYYSAIDIVRADTNHRVKRQGHEFFFDNVLAECAIKPGYTKQEVLDNFSGCFKAYAKIVKPYVLTPQASHEYPEDQLNNKHARKAACVPEWSAYKMSEIKQPKDMMQNSCLRTAGAHIHLGCDFLKNSIIRPFVVYMLDLFLGIPSVFMDHDPTSKSRRKMYGQAGSYREKKAYGLEYRPLGPFWTTSPDRVALIWDVCEWVLEFCANGGYKKFWSIDESQFDGDDPAKAYSCYGYDHKLLQKAINTCNEEEASNFMKLIEFYLPCRLMTAIKKQTVDEPVDFYAAWNLK